MDIGDAVSHHIHSTVVVFLIFDLWSADCFSHDQIMLLYISDRRLNAVSKVRVRAHSRPGQPAYSPYTPKYLITF